MVPFGTSQVKDTFYYNRYLKPVPGTTLDRSSIDRLEKREIPEPPPSVFRIEGGTIITEPHLSGASGEGF
ncbi:hypothetical protein AND_005091 [Anopheles darlingi]|uniref:Uncharacterized protein n=1 Tax=Anopheles darlingi TaxID=43151 RepID=W5JFS2_ANODA|nr:hypothetical protein AND_005091 [Anopheles darlingi]